MAMRERVWHVYVLLAHHFLVTLNDAGPERRATVPWHHISGHRDISRQSSYQRLHMVEYQLVRHMYVRVL